jgi:hypothetical protein
MDISDLIAKINFTNKKKHPLYLQKDSVEKTYCKQNEVNKDLKLTNIHLIDHNRRIFLSCVFNHFIISVFNC